MEEQTQLENQVEQTYIQMTLDQWLAMKQRLKEELIGVRSSFVRIGYILRRIDDCRGYEQEGYKSVVEFARAEYGLEASTVSRFMAINKEYSVDGYSEMILPEYMDFSRSQLEEMLKLPAADREMITPETPREVIRELKRFNKEAGKEVEQAEEEVHEREPDAEKEQTPTEDETQRNQSEQDAERGKTTLQPVNCVEDVVKYFWKEDRELALELIKSEAYQTGEVDKLKEIVNPSGSRVYKKGLYFLSMTETDIKIKKFRENPQTMQWTEFFVLTRQILEEKENEEPEEVQEEDTADLKKKTVEDQPEQRKDTVAPAQKKGIKDDKMEIRANLSLYKVRSKELAEKARELTNAEKWKEAEHTVRLLLNALETVADYEKQVK